MSVVLYLFNLYIYILKMKCYDWLVLIINYKKVLWVWVDICKLFYCIFIYKNIIGGESVYLLFY